MQRQLGVSLRPAVDTVEPDEFPPMGFGHGRIVADASGFDSDGA